MLQNKKSLGQNWLKNREILDEIAAFAATERDVEPLCLEIGPGLGTLTSSLLRRFPEVLAIEYDEKLANNLPKSFPGKNLKVLHEDFLQFDLSKIKEPYVVAANIPYYITSPIIMKLIQANPQPERIVLLIQKEVAERIAAKQGKHTVLSLSVQNAADVFLGPVVGREYFTPPPKVDSQIIILEPKTPQVEQDVFKIIKQGFSSPRKKLVANLGNNREELLQIFEKIGLNKDCRASDLSLEDWKKLAEFNHNR